MFMRSVVLSAVILATFPTLVCALEDIYTVTRQQATDMGLIFRAKAAGPDAVSVELEFPTTGALKGFQGVQLRIEDGKRLLFYSMLREETLESGHVVVSFYVDRARIPQCELKIATRGDGLTRVGHILPLKDFVDLTKVR